jgi:hypothetical protein
MSYQTDAFQNDAFQLSSIAYGVTITPSAVPIGGQTVTPRYGRSTTITPASVPIGGATVTPKRTYTTTITAGTVPIDGSLVAPIYARAISIAPFTIPIIGLSLTPVYIDLVSLFPVAGGAAGLWTDQAGGSSLYEAIDEEVASIVDYIQSPIHPAGDVARIKLSSPRPILEPMTVSYEYGKNIDAGSLSLTVRLMQGSTTIATWTHPNVTYGWQIANQELTSLEFATITNASDLYIELEAA